MPKIYDEFLAELPKHVEFRGMTSGMAEEWAQFIKKEKDMFINLKCTICQEYRIEDLNNPYGRKKHDSKEGNYTVLYIILLNLFRFG